MLPLLLASLMLPALDSAPPMPPAIFAQDLRALDAVAWRDREAATARLSLAPRAQLLAAWDLARRDQLSASQRARLRTAIAGVRQRGGAISLAACELGASPFEAPSASEEERFRAWLVAFPIHGELEERRAANACWDTRGEAALHFLEGQSSMHPELARWTDAAARRLRWKLFNLLEF